MSDHPGTDSFNPDARDFLLEEYRSLSTTLLTNEQVGETRVNWFIGIVTAVIGGLVAMVTAEKPGVSDNTVQLIVIGFLLGLLILGLITLCRILKRNATTDGLIKDIKRIREIFRDYYDPDSVLLNYSAFGPPPGHSDEEEDSDEEADRKFGGLADLVSALNSLIIAALAGAILFPLGTVFGWSGAAAAFFLSLWLHRLYVRKRHQEVKEELRSQKPFTRAGGVVFKFENGIPKYLFARPKNRANEWILPKGQIDGDEEPRETALREVAEETGVFARLLRPLGVMEFSGEKDELVRTKFYLMELIFRGKAIEQPARETKWFSFDEAQGDEFHSQTKSILFIAEQRVRERGRSGEQPESKA